MFNFSFKKINNKKLLFFVFLFFIVLFFTHQTTKAADPATACAGGDRNTCLKCCQTQFPPGAGEAGTNNLTCIRSCSEQEIQGTLFGLAWPNGEELGAAYKAEWDWLTSWGKDILNGIIAAVGLVLASITSALSSIAGQLLAWIISPEFMPYSYTGTDNPAVGTGWPIIRDLANMFVVLGFIVVGIAFTLRLESYGSKKVLMRLIVVAVLIYFSLLICGIVIDASNITTTYFLKSSGFISQPMSEIVAKQTSAMATNFKSNSNLTATLASAAGITFENIMAFIVFMLFSFLFLFRYIALWILVILSPIAFVFSVFPLTQKFFNMWRDNFIGWCMIGITGSFFLYLSEKVGSVILKASTAPSTLFTGLVPGFILLAGFIFALRTSSMGASAVIGLAGAAGGYALGATKGGGGRIGRLADRLSGGRFSAASERTKDSFARFSEWAGGKTGSAAQARQQRARDAEKQVEALLSAPAGSRDRRRGEELVRNGRGAMGAAAVSKANETGQLGDILGNDRNQINQRANYAGGFGYARKGFEDKHHFLASMDPERVAREQARLGGVSEARARSSLERQGVEKNWDSMSANERANVDISGWHADDQRDFVMGSRGSAFMDAQRSLPTTHATRLNNRTVIHGMIGGNAGSNQADLDIGAGRHIDDALDEAYDRGDSNAQKKYKELRNKARGV